ncbi:MAG: DMT family transporter [Pseudotabrizicola sp.]|uniref:DMT family transporter n=1 Tax=Pseudotabrizicola sp. TaxID=2939647 RepID=UPI00271E3DE0|nr:DMT family transporter [Pseudotabrizicola sp.]MDO8882463.1 DMT family transporter [Pseudotabrizicola sp.]MDP2082300.1 DMT family transporter [Pseudotabrizicola sp.]MDZ7575220.1 DMT family transporter [Pseudotabrizicola sp.]
MSRNPRLGIWLMIAAVAAFAAQDGFSRYLASEYNTLMVVMVRYWVFAGFVTLLALRRPEGLRSAVASRHMRVHVARSLLLVGEICVIVWGYTLIGLIESHAVFAICPLLIAAFSGLILGERIIWQRWLAIGAGMLGVVVILRPGMGVFTPAALLPLAAAVMFALYSILTRLTTRDEPTFPSFFWPGVIGAGLMTVAGLPNWQAVAPADLPLLAIYAVISIFSHWLLLKCYEQIEAARVQPYAYLQIVFVTLIGLTVYNETLSPLVALGAGIIIAAGLYALSLERTAKT